MSIKRRKKRSALSFGASSLPSTRPDRSILYFSYASSFHKIRTDLYLHPYFLRILDRQCQFPHGRLSHLPLINVDRRKRRVRDGPEGNIVKPYDRHILRYPVSILLKRPHRAYGYRIIIREISSRYHRRLIQIPLHSFIGTLNPGTHRRDILRPYGKPISFHNSFESNLPVPECLYPEVSLDVSDVLMSLACQIFHRLCSRIRVAYQHAVKKSTGRSTRPAGLSYS